MVTTKDYQLIQLYQKLCQKHLNVVRGQKLRIINNLVDHKTVIWSDWAHSL